MHIAYYIYVHTCIHTYVFICPVEYASVWFLVKNPQALSRSHFLRQRWSLKQHGRSDASSHADLILRKALPSATGGSLKRHWRLAPAAKNLSDVE